MFSNIEGSTFDQEQQEHIYLQPGVHVRPISNSFLNAHVQPHTAHLRVRTHGRNSLFI